jgi:hypothetical protein
VVNARKRCERRAPIVILKARLLPDPKDLNRTLAKAEESNLLVVWKRK